MPDPFFFLYVSAVLGVEWVEPGLILQLDHLLGALYNCDVDLELMS